MADNVNEFTLKLANFLLKDDVKMFGFSISGFVAYMTLSFVSNGLQGHTKDQLLHLLNCNFSNMEISYTRTQMETQCLNSFLMDEFSAIGSAQSAIFHSKPVFENFQQMARDFYDIEMHPIDPTNHDIQQYTIDEWSKKLIGVYFNDVFKESIHEDISILIVNEYFARFKWKTPFNPRSIIKGIFTDISMNNITADFMKMTDIFRFYNDVVIGASIIFIPLVDDDMYAVIMLPYPDKNLLDILPRINVEIKIICRMREYIPGLIFHCSEELIYFYLNLEYLAKYL
ncbi:Antithrombin-III [Thelohanellus kitauei]|uniref:Antithrombin-III n=1 Tax=Thelohanellus kitauei TaxID=669202 RepID=A0A0C2J4R9_THEKT|nr:Antithrombin-III [Thelohanellus kitauei]